MDGTDLPPTEPAIDSGERSATYRLVEGLHLRQWALRLAAPLAVLATNGEGWIDASWWPRALAPMDWWELPTWVPAACRAAGLVLVVLAVWGRVLSKGVLVRKTELTTGGVYRLVRHPFYLANLVGALGVFTLAGPLGALTGAIWLVFALPIYAWTVGGEEDGLRTLYPEAWERFESEVPALIPVPGRFGSPPQAPVAVTWRNLVAEREPARGLRFLAVALLVGGLSVEGTPGAIVLGLGVLAFAASHLVPGPPSRRRAPTG